MWRGNFCGRRGWIEGVEKIKGDGLPQGRRGRRERQRQTQRQLRPAEAGRYKFNSHARSLEPGAFLVLAIGVAEFFFQDFFFPAHAHELQRYEDEKNQQIPRALEK
jgi:hypothetical protein